MSGASGANADIGALLDGSPWTIYQKLLTALTAFAALLDGFDLQVLAFAIPTLVTEWHVARSSFGPVLALGLAGMAVGGPLVGYAGDRYGRRPALIASVGVFGLATIGTAFVSGLGGLAVLRFLTGVGAGGAVPNASALAAEFAPLRRRPVAVKLTIVCIPLGGMLGGLIAAIVLPGLGWRALYLIGGTTPLLYALLLWWLLPESPRFLATQPNSRPQLLAFLSRMGIPVAADTEFAAPAEKFAAKTSSVSALFTNGLAHDTIGLWVAYFFCLAAIYLVFGWLPALLTAQGMNVATASTGLAVYNFGGVLGVLVWSVLTAVRGSRRPLVIGALAAAVSAVAMLLVPAHATPWLIAGLTLNGLLANAVQTSMYALAAHVYPTAVRASGVAYAAAAGRVGGLLSSFFGGTMIQAGAPWYWWTVAIAMVFTGAGLAFVRNHFSASKGVNVQ